VSDKIKNGEKMLLPASQKKNQPTENFSPAKSFFIQLMNTFKLILTETVGTA
jgi:hypothetical protein